MTAITGFVEPVRRPGELGVHSLDHFSLQVPDLAKARHFYSNFGLDVPEEGNRLGMYVGGNSHRWGTLSEGSKKKLSHITFGAYEDDLPRFRARLQEMKIKELDPPKGHESNGVWFRDHDGNLIELVVAELRQQGFSLLDIRRFLEAHGFVADGFELPLQTLATTHTPAIVLMRIGNTARMMTMKSFALSPRPNHSTTSGTTATSGVA